ncbi:MAG: AAA family ATPase [Alphaproteobacteria bacterium]|nr:AAA family ATPase [Alphaproteobacteria bacterium]
MFEKEQNQIIASLNVPSAAKSWLIIGPRGVGKRVLAEQLVVALTKNRYDFNPDVRWIECGLTDAAKKEIQKALLAGEQIEDKEWSKKKEISVDDVREACHFLSLKSNKIKVLVFNLADNMSEEAQNALLKTLEEPYPNSLILLLTENIGHLFPTILSRCQKVSLIPPTLQELDAIMIKKYPQLSEEERQDIARLADYLPGIVDDIVANQGVDLYYRLNNLIVPANQINGGDVLTFAAAVEHDNMALSLCRRFLLKIIAQKAIETSGISMEKSYVFSSLYDKISQLFAQMDELNLDKKETIVSTIYQLSEAL